MIRRWLFPLLLTVAVAACSQTPSGSPAQPMYDQFDRDWQYWMTQYPEVATALGVSAGEGRWTSYSQESMTNRETYLRESLQRFEFIDRETLPDGDRLNYDLYRQMLESAVAGLDLRNDALPVRGVIARHLAMPMNQMEGIQQDIPRTIAIMPARTADDLGHIVSRLRGIPTLVDETIALMRGGLADGMTPPRIALRDLPGQVAAQVVSDPLTSPMLAAFVTRPAGLDEAAWTPLVEQATSTYAQQVAPAFRRLQMFLVDEYLPASRETTGANALPRGDALYHYNVWWHTTTSLTAQEIHDIGLGEVARLRGELARVVAGAGYSSRSDGLGRILRADRHVRHARAGEVPQGGGSTVAQEVASVPAFRRHSTFTAFVEGWAMYSARQEMEFYTELSDTVGQLNDELWRAVGLVVDTGLHAQGWSRQQAIDYMRANTVRTPEHITREVDQYLVWPGQVLAYKMGEILIREWRAMAEQELEDSFDIPMFHGAVLGSGAMPLDVVETRVRAWVERSKGSR